MHLGGSDLLGEYRMLSLAEWVQNSEIGGPGQ